MVKSIVLVNDRGVTTVSAEDYEMLSQYKWCLHSGGYANTNVNGKTVLMHRMIMGYPQNMVDHIDENRLNNTRANLREATRSQNLANRGKTRANTSGYKGVYKYKNSSTWFAQIRVNGKDIYLGAYQDPKAAADAYDQAALKLFKEFSKLNKGD